MERPVPSQVPLLPRLDSHQIPSSSPHRSRCMQPAGHSITDYTQHALGMSRRALSSLLTTTLTPLAYALLSSGTWVYDVGTSFILWNLLIFLVGFAFLSGITRRQRILHFKMTWIKGIIILMIVLAAAIAPPSFATFLRAQSGQYINYQW